MTFVYNVSMSETAASTDEMRVDDLARAAGVASTTIRLYQTKGLLPGPRVVGRTGYYDEHHLARLRLIHRLQSEGFSLAGIRRLLDTWQDGRELSDLVGVESQLDALIGVRRGVTLTPQELAERLPVEVLDPALMQRAVTLGLVELTDSGSIHLPDERFLDTGAALAALGIPVDAILDEWERLADLTDQIAAAFVGLFERHLLPTGGLADLDPDRTATLAASLGQLRSNAHQILGVAFDASLARVASERLGQLAEEL